VGVHEGYAAGEKNCFGLISHTLRIEQEEVITGAKSELVLGQDGLKHDKAMMMTSVAPTPAMEGDCLEQLKS